MEKLEQKETYRVILGSITLLSLSYEEGIKDDGTLAQKISEILVKELEKYGVGEVDIDLEKSVKIKPDD